MARSARGWLVAITQARHVWVMYVVVAVLWAGVDVVAAVSNDGVWVLNHAYGLRTGGLVELGYRFVGYPLLVRLMIEAAGLLNIDPLFGLILFQRLLALAVGLLLVRLYRWVGVAVFAVGFSVTTLVQIDYILAESLAVVLAAVGAIAFARTWYQSRWRLIWFVVLTVVVLAMAAMRTQYTVFVVAPAAIVVDSWLRDGRGKHLGTFTRQVLALFVVLVIAIASFNVLVARENIEEYGRPSLASRNRSSVAYLSAWRVVFVIEGVSPNNLELSLAYAEGSPWPSWRDVRIENKPEDWEEAFNQATEELLQASGLNLTRLYVESFWGGLLGGRFDDMSGIKQRVTADSLQMRLSSTYASANVQRMGEQEFLVRYNDGLEPGALIMSPAIPTVPMPPWYLLGMAWMILSIAALASPRFGARGKAFVVIASVPHIAVVTVGATFLGDTYRWLLPTLVFSFVAIAGAVGETLTMPIVGDDIDDPSSEQQVGCATEPATQS